MIAERAGYRRCTLGRQVTQPIAGLSQVQYISQLKGYDCPENTVLQEALASTASVETRQRRSAGGIPHPIPYSPCVFWQNKATPQHATGYKEQISCHYRGSSTKRYFGDFQQQCHITMLGVAHPSKVTSRPPYASLACGTIRYTALRYLAPL